MKKLDREYRTHPEKTKLMNKAALELNITSATFNCKSIFLFLRKKNDLTAVYY